jgi:ABC-type multidrug transport system fused ATPase/permease subunit
MHGYPVIAGQPHRSDSSSYTRVRIRGAGRCHGGLIGPLASTSFQAAPGAAFFRLCTSIDRTKLTQGHFLQLTSEISDVNFALGGRLMTAALRSQQPSLRNRSFGWRASASALGQILCWTASTSRCAGRDPRICGENGAGKSTCLGLLYGLHQPSGWHRFTAMRESCASTARRMRRHLAIGCVFQELSLAGALSVAENIYAGRAPSRLGVVDWRELNRRAEALLSEFGSGS